MARLKGPTLKTLEQVRKVVSQELRRVVQSESMDDATRARLIFHGAQLLGELVEKTEIEQKVDEQIESLKEIKARPVSHVPFFEQKA